MWSRVYSLPVWRTADHGWRHLGERGFATTAFGPGICRCVLRKSLGWPEIGLSSWTNAAEFCSQDQALLAGLLERLALKNFSAAAPAHVGSHCNPAARIDQQRLGRLIQMLPQDEALGNSRVVDAPVPSSSASSCPKPSAAPDRFLRRVSKTL